MRKELADWYEAASRRSFEYGVHDCGLSVADAVQAQTGKKIAEEFRGKRSMLEAHRAIKKAGGYAAICDSKLGPRINPRMARKGDVHLIGDGRHEVLAIDMGTHVTGFLFGKFQSITKGELKDSAKIISTWRAE